MTTAFRLLRDTLAGRHPPRILLHGLMNTLSRRFAPGRRRYELERLYLETEDPWNYRTNPIEHAKYRHTLAAIKTWRVHSGRVLEIACSIGVFTRMLTDEFSNVTGVDFSTEALRINRKYNSDRTNLTFVHSYVQELDTADIFDVILCSEVLYYVPETDTEAVFKNLDACLARDGVLVLVHGVHEAPADSLSSRDWHAFFATRYVMKHDEIVEAERPYRLSVYARA